MCLLSLKTAISSSFSISTKVFPTGCWLTFIIVVETYESWQFLKNLEYDKMGRTAAKEIFQSSTDSGVKNSVRPSDFDHVSYLAGVRIIPPTLNPSNKSGYQVHRLATQLIPAYFSILEPRNVSPFWAVLFYLSMIMLGVSQCLALFHTVIQGIIAIKPSGLKAWEGSITFIVCSLGFILGLPAGTEVSKITFQIFFMACAKNIIRKLWHDKDLHWPIHLISGFKMKVYEVVKCTIGGLSHKARHSREKIKSWSWEDWIMYSKCKETTTPYMVSSVDIFPSFVIYDV